MLKVRCTTNSPAHLRPSAHLQHMAGLNALPAEQQANAARALAQQQRRRPAATRQARNQHAAAPAVAGQRARSLVGQKHQALLVWDWESGRQQVSRRLRLQHSSSKCGAHALNAMCICLASPPKHAIPCCPAPPHLCKAECGLGQLRREAATSGGRASAQRRRPLHSIQNRQRLVAAPLEQGMVPACVGQRWAGRGGHGPACCRG